MKVLVGVSLVQLVHHEADEQVSSMRNDSRSNHGLKMLEMQIPQCVHYKVWQRKPLQRLFTGIPVWFDPATSFRTA